MKLKFRAEAKDWALFGILCLVVLLVVAIAVSNLASIASGDGLSGINPLPAFSSNNILMTIVCFIVIISIIFTSVSSYFFDIEKGVGISTNAKEEKGYSRWLKEKEMKKQLKLVDPKAYNSPYAGIPLINNGKEMWVDDGEYHSLIIDSPFLAND